MRPLRRTGAQRQGLDQRHGTHVPPDVACPGPVPVDTGGALSTPVVRSELVVSSELVLVDVLVAARAACVSARATAATAAEPSALAAAIPRVTAVARRSPLSREDIVFPFDWMYRTVRIPRCGPKLCDRCAWAQGRMWTGSQRAHSRTTSPAPTRPVRPARPRWVRPAVAALLLGTALLYLWGLGASGWANGYYSAAAQAGSASWKAWFFGSFDAGNAITVDKTPAALWIMGLSVRLFGLNAWSILVPEALAGVAAVGLLHATVRRWFGPVAGLLAGAVFAITPVAVLMFRFNNPDALLVLFLVAAAYAVTRALERASTRWLVLAGALVGFGFLTKMLQAVLVLPGFGLVYLVAAPTSMRRRLGQLALATLAMVGAAGWWVAGVALWPAASRPYIGGSQHNSILELTLGYNGFGRLTGEETGSVGGMNGWGTTGWSRLFTAEIGGQVAWLLPAALVLLAAGLWLRGRAPRIDRPRAALMLWGGWLLVTAATFSFMQGIFHAYYTVALAPAIGALAGIGATLLWRARRLSTDLVLAAVLAGTAGYALNTAATVHNGAIPSAGPVVAGARFGGPGGPRVGGPLRVGVPPAGAGPVAGGPAPSGGPVAGRPGGMGGLLTASTPSTELVTLLTTDSGRYRWVAATVGANNAAGYQLATAAPA